MKNFPLWGSGHLGQYAAAYAQKISGYLSQNIGFYPEKAPKPGNLYEFFTKSSRLECILGLTTPALLGAGSDWGPVKNP